MYTKEKNHLFAFILPFVQCPFDPPPPHQVLIFRWCLPPTLKVASLPLAVECISLSKYTTHLTSRRVITSLKWLNYDTISTSDFVIWTWSWCMLLIMGCRNFAQKLITAFSKKKNLPRYEWTLSSSGILNEKKNTSMPEMILYMKIQLISHASITIKILIKTTCAHFWTGNRKNIIFRFKEIYIMGESLDEKRFKWLNMNFYCVF